MRENYELSHDEIYEETDELYRPKKQNSRKSLAPAFIYRVLLRNSSPEEHIMQSDLIEMLEGYPYEISIERKAVGRIVHGLADSGIGIRFKKGEGCWYDSEEDYMI